MESKSLDTLYWVLFACYVISFCLPAHSFRTFQGTSTTYGFQAAYIGVMFYGLAVPAHISAIGGLIHRLNMKNPANPCHVWHGFSIVFSIIGTISWQFLFIKEVSIGYYIWLITTIGMAIAYYSFRLAKSKETVVEEGAVKNEGGA